MSSNMIYKRLVRLREVDNNEIKNPTNFIKNKRIQVERDHYKKLCELLRTQIMSLGVKPVELPSLNKQSSRVPVKRPQTAPSDGRRKLLPVGFTSKKVLTKISLSESLKTRSIKPSIKPKLKTYSDPLKTRSIKPIIKVPDLSKIKINKIEKLHKSEPLKTRRLGNKKNVEIQISSNHLINRRLNKIHKPKIMSKNNILF